METKQADIKLLQTLCIIHIGVSVSASSCPSIFSDKNSLSEEYTTTHRYHIQQELINDLTCYMY